MIQDIIDIKIKMIITKKMLCKFTAIDPQRKKKSIPFGRIGIARALQDWEAMGGVEEKEGKAETEKIYLTIFTSIRGKERQWHFRK